MISAALAVLKTDEERNALSEIYTKNIKSFYSIAFSKLHNAHDSEDAIQEAFLAIARNFFAIPQEKRVSYINVMIRNISFSIWNKKLKIEDTQVELDENILDESVSLDEKISSELSCIEIYRFIDTLSETTKTALYLKIHFHMKYSDIASQLEISEEAVKKRIARATVKIKQFMEDNHE